MISELGSCTTIGPMSTVGAAKESEMQSSFRKINIKLDHLRNLLSPVLNQNKGLESVAEKMPPRSIIVSELQNIDDQLAYLLDRIDL